MKRAGTSEASKNSSTAEVRTMDRPPTNDDEHDSECVTINDRPSIHPSPQPEEDRVNVSRDDSDLGGEYFLRMNPSWWCLSPSDHLDDHSGTGFHDYQPNPTLLKRSSGVADEGSMARDEHPSRFIPPTRCWSNNSLYGESIEGSLNPAPSQPFVLHPQFRSRGTSHSIPSDFDSVSEDSNGGNNLLVLSTSDAQFSYHSVDFNDENATNVTPPSVPYPPSLSPPPLYDESKGPHNLPSTSHSQNQTVRSHPLPPRVIRACHSRESLAEYSSSHSKGTGKTALQPHRPPRAPTRCHVPVLHSGSGSYSSLPHNISSSMNSLHQPVALPPNPVAANHTRAHSSGDTSILSALTDSDYEGGAFLPEKCSTACGAGSYHGAMAPLEAPLSHASWPEQRPQPSTDVVWGMHIDIPSFLQQPILIDDVDDRHDTELGSIGCLSSTIGLRKRDAPCGPYDLPELHASNGTSHDKERHLDATVIPRDLYDELDRLRIATASTAAENTAPDGTDR